LRETKRDAPQTLSRISTRGEIQPNALSNMCLLWILVKGNLVFFTRECKSFAVFLSRLCCYNK